MKILITGKNGQLAQSFLRRCAARNIDVDAPEESIADITSIDSMQTIMHSTRPNVIINCAAYNAVDLAESDSSSAFRINGEGPLNLAKLSHEAGAFLVHFGSDYVFDGRKETGLYKEEDCANPINIYGSSKLHGENNIKKVTDNFLIFRLSWVFGSGQQNFIRKLLEWSSKNDYLKISCDEFSVPTSTETVVDVTLEALRQGVTGTFHLTNSGFCSRYEWARFIFRERSIDKFLRPVTMETFSLPAKRPVFSAMDNNTISRLLGVEIPHWQDAVRAFLKSGNS